MLLDRYFPKYSWQLAMIILVLPKHRNNLTFLFFYLQEIKIDNELKGTSSCKIALYRVFLKCGNKTWEQVIKALQNSDHGKIAEQVKLQLLKNYNEVISYVVL